MPVAAIGEGFHLEVRLGIESSRSSAACSRPDGGRAPLPDRLERLHETDQARELEGSRSRACATAPPPPSDPRASRRGRPAHGVPPRTAFQVLVAWRSIQARTRPPPTRGTRRGTARLELESVPQRPSFNACRRRRVRHRRCPVRARRIRAPGSARPRHRGGISGSGGLFRRLRPASLAVRAEKR